MIWSEEVVATLRASLADGLTCSQIANLLFQKYGMPVTRCAVGGKISRLGLKSQNKPVAINVQMQRKAARSSLQKVEPKSLAQALLDLGSNDCRWPLETAFCRQLASPGFPYCADHCRIAYLPRRHACR